MTPATDRPLRVLSFGAGVQSSYLARLSLIGELPRFDHVIFADTGDEPAGVYTNLAWWEQRFSDEGLPFHVVRANKGAITDEIRRAVRGERKGVPTPVFMRKSDGSMAMVSRQCTKTFKIDPVARKITELVGLTRRPHRHITDHLVSQFIGISWDEAQRMKDPIHPWMRNVYPLVDRRITRATIKAEFAAQDEFPQPPRSACWHCPYMSDESWRLLRNSSPDDFDKAVALDAELRAPGALPRTNLDGPVFLHRSGVPLADVDFDNAEDKGQLTMADLWGNECEGMCGL